MNLEKIEKDANVYAERVCNLHSAPNAIDLLKLKNLLSYSDRYQISVQFWPEQFAVFIEKDGVDLIDYGGDFDFAVGNAIEYLDRITSHNCH